MILRKKQECFALMVTDLIREAFRQGFTVTLGEAWRPPEMCAIYAKKAIGIKESLHEERLAIDLNLFKDGKWLMETEDHRPLGEWWELQSTAEIKTAWGGRFGDGCHYSVTHGGKK